MTKKKTSSQASNQWPSALIPDGHTRNVGIAGESAVHPPVNFTYRAFRGAEGVKWFGMLYSKEEGDAKKLHHMMAQRIEKWDLSHPLSAETMGKLESNLWHKLFLVIIGRAAPDSEYTLGKSNTKTTKKKPAVQSDKELEGDLGNSIAG